MCVAREPVLLLIPVGSAPAAHCSSECMGAHFPSHLFSGEWRWVMVTTMPLVAVVATLDTSWDYSMDCLSCGGGCVRV
jgi:hypothetical protein